MPKVRLQKLNINKNTRGFRITGIAAAALFPVFLVLLCEANQLGSTGKMFANLFSRPGVLVFDILFVGLIYSAVFLFTKKGWIAALPTGAFFFILSCVEFFKYDVSKSHFLPQDLALAGELGEISGMARLRMTPLLFINITLLVLYLLLLVFLETGVRMKLYKRLTLGALCLVLACMAVVPPVSGAVFAFFGVDSRESVNVFVSKSKFDNDNMIAFLVSEVSDMISDISSAPKGYSQDAVLDCVTDTSDGNSESGFQANVIVILDESYGDFRRICGADDAIDDTIYENFDAAAQKGRDGIAIVPTFGGYTCRSEFEFLAGVPLACFSNPVLPQNLFKTDKIEGIPALFASLGYRTIYMHPSNGDFYDRRAIYPSFGFDKMLYQEDFDIENNIFRNYADDGVVFSSAIDLIKQNSEPVFIFAMTMQNHQPYYYDADKGVDELGYYLVGVEHTDERLGELISDIDSVDEPTLLFFIGDHLPFFGLDGNSYERVGFDETNSDVLFEQRYLLYSNYGADFSAMPDGKLSLFYIPYYVLFLSNPMSYPVIADTMMAISERLPVYTSAYDTETAFVRDGALDMLAYDRILGKGYSAGLGNCSPD